MNRYFTIIFFLVFIKSINVNAQDTIEPVKKSTYNFKPQDYIEDMSSLINVSPFMYQTKSDFTVSGRKNIRYSPNDGNNIGIKLQHRWLGIAISYSPGKLQEAQKGTTDVTHIILNSYGKKIGFDAYYLNYKGYYLQNYKDLPFFKNTIMGNIFPQRSDMQTTNAGLNVYYIFNNKKFSIRAPFANNDWQKKSAGSFILTSSLNYYNLSADSTLVYARVDTNAEELTRIKKGDFYSVSFMPGYAYTYVISKHVFITLAPSVGLVYQYQHYYTETNNLVESFELIPRAMIRGAVGYAGRRYFFGVTSVADMYNIPIARSYKLTYEIGNITLYAGIRLGVPKYLQKFSSFLNKCNPSNISVLLKVN